MLRATSRRTVLQAASPRATPYGGCRREGSSYRSGLGQKSREIDRVALELFEENQQTMVGQPLRVQNPLEVIAFVLNDAGVKAFGLALDGFAVEVGCAVADAQMARDNPAQTRNRQATLPAQRAVTAQQLDHGVDQHGQILGDIAGHPAEALARHEKDDDPPRLVDLRRG